MTHSTSRIRLTFTVIVGSMLLLGTAYAGAPMVKTQAPGFYRFMLGDFEVTALFDGTLDLYPSKLLTNTTPANITKMLASSFEKEPLPTSVNAYLINTGGKLLLVDTGTGSLLDSGLGAVASNLKASGYQLDQVDEICLTHMHIDHLGGLVSDGTRVFPNAIVRADQREADYWLNQASMNKAPANEKEFFKAAMTAMTPYVSANKFKPFDGDTEVMPGIKTLMTRGHTPGHSIFVVESQGQKLVLWGDLIHVAAVQFPQPQVTIIFDSDPKAAAVQRKKAFADAARKGYLVGSPHLPFPGLGHLRAGGNGYVFVPLDYTMPK
jgi:glyoxylase-like metal-dependent hydrolase (beta-lactamase superfamily II)